MGSKESSEVVVTDIKMSFSSMVVFMVKWAIATIPAIIILTAAGSLTLVILKLIFGNFHSGMRFWSVRKVFEDEQGYWYDQDTNTSFVYFFCSPT